MKRIPQETLDYIRNQVNIVDVVASYVPLTKKGKSHKCVCPFHDDHDPSMSISEDKQIYHCFVCGAGGNAYHFVQNFEKISFMEAVAKVAKMANVELDYDITSATNKPKDPHIEALHKVCQEAIAFCSYELQGVEAKPIMEYLHSRGLSDAVIQKFELGYHPKDNRLYQFLHAKKYKDSDIVDANLAWITPQGIKDVFTHRIMIPIHDAQGNPVGFSARRVDSTQEAKYVNTSETDVYHKGNLLYNYHRAKESAKRAGKVIVVEGAMDVLAFEKAGITYSVATLGTACTKQQLRLLRYLGVKIILCYDGDKAGQEATYKFYKLAQTEGLDVEIIHNSYNLDPDEIIETYGKEELLAFANKTQSWIEFVLLHLQKKYDLNNYSEKKEYAKQVAKEITLLKDDFEKKNYYMRLQQITQFDMSGEEQVVLRQSPTQQRRKRPSVTHPIKGELVAQYQILSQMLISKSAMEYYRSNLGFLRNEECNALALYIVDFYRTHERIIVADLLDYIKEDDSKKILLKIANWELAMDTYQEEVLQEAVSKIKESMIEEKIKLLKEQSNQVNDPIEKAKIAKEMISLRLQGGLEHGKKDEEGN